jgi:hypothetical protein
MGSKACSFTTGFTFDISGGRATAWDIKGKSGGKW